ncbi:MAG: SpoIVB peptidase [Bacillota bacterium]|jgi:stage IV sporulation protein B|nr:SpoIVB peptidase [Clostridia bacterium]
MPPKHKFIQKILILVIIFSASFTTAFYSYFLLPSEQKLVVGDSLNLPKVKIPEFINNISVYVESNRNNVFEINGCPVTQKIYKYNGEAPVVTEPGQLNLRLKLFGIIPLKNMMVDVLPEVRVVPGGHSVGVMLQTDGVLTVGHSPVYQEEGQICYPAKEAGLELGDHILEINNTKIKNEKHAAELIHQLGSKGPLEILAKHKGEKKLFTVIPKYCVDTKTYRIGLYIRDNAAGVGTITFYEPIGGQYGALGHMIVDLETVDTKEKGRIVKADVQGIKPGKKGEPGEKIGIFNGDELRGSIEINSHFGIFGRLNKPLNNPYFKNGVPIAFSNQIQEGPAEIITVISGDKLEKFDIEILRVLPQHQPTGKGLVIQITDPKLLQTTGGIIQGMSGSPIIQNNKLVGAVTHVFVNDPTKGYGCLAEWMLLEAGIVDKEASSLPEIMAKSPVFI